MLDLRAVVHHLLEEQMPNMLDKQKCSITARNIFNYLAQGEKVNANNNLSMLLPSLDALAIAIQAHASSGDAAVYYVHYDHLTNDTSHYFILCCVGGYVLVLQSAVFEFSIYEWLFPEDARSAVDASIISDFWRLAASNDIRDSFTLEQAQRDHAQQCAVLDSISRCKYSQGRLVPISEFVRDYIDSGLRMLVGQWTLDNLEARSSLFQNLFACILQRDVIRSHISLGFTKEAAVKHVSAPLRVECCGQVCDHCFTSPVQPPIWTHASWHAAHGPP